MREVVYSLVAFLILNYQTTVLADVSTQSKNSEGPQPELSAPSPYKVSLWNPQNNEDKDRLWSQTKLLFGLGLGAMGVISLIPEDVSNWDFGDGKPVQKWWDNVRSGPIWDEDVWHINYIGHTYFGGVYYQVARKSGYNQWDSFTYSALMSTFYWEYGLEAFAEVPSIQDLAVTPIGGWIYGEWAYEKEKEIIANDGMALGSEFWGSTALFFLDPVDKIGAGINHMLGKKLIRSGAATISQFPNYVEPVAMESYGDYLGIDLLLTF